MAITEQPDSSLGRLADVVLQVRCFGANEQAGRADLELMRPGQVIMGFCEPLAEAKLAQEAAQAAAQGSDTHQEPSEPAAAPEEPADAAPKATAEAPAVTD